MCGWPAVIPLAPATSAVRLPAELCWSACAGSANVWGQGYGDDVGQPLMCLAQQGSPSLLSACQPEAPCWSIYAGGANAEHGTADLGAGLPSYPRLTKEAINALRYRGEDVARSLTKTVIKEVGSCSLLGRSSNCQVALQFGKSSGPAVR